MSEWERRAQSKRQALEDLIPLEWQLSQSALRNSSYIRDLSSCVEKYISPYESEITQSSATDLLARIKTGDLTAFEVTRAFCHRASIAHQLVSQYIKGQPRTLMRN